MAQVSIKQVAELAGVSIATVSRCINDPSRVRESTRERVQEAIQKTGYTPNTIAQSFRRGRTNVILVVLPSVGDPFFTDVMNGIRSVMSSQGYSIIINESRRGAMTEDEVGGMLMSRQADGVIVLGTHFPFGQRVLSRVRNMGKPIVVGCEMISDSLTDLPSVQIDNVAAADEATRYLISQGHQKIAFMSGRSNSILTQDREFGFRSAMKSAGLSLNEDWVREGNLSIEGAIEATSELLGLPDRPSAIFCANDEMAIGCIRGIKDQGLRVPKDVSVIGFDDIRYARASDPPLTTIAQPANEIGERVAERMMESILNGTQATDLTPEIVPCRLVIRESVSSPP